MSCPRRALWGICLVTSLLLQLGCSPDRLPFGGDRRGTEPIVEDPTVDTSTETALKADWLVLPRERVGRITRSTSENALVELYGLEQIQQGDIHTGEGQLSPGTILFPGDKERELQILWQNPIKREIPKEIRRLGSKWHTAEGIAKGTTLKDLEKMNAKPFSLYGFGWDYGGTVSSWESGELEAKLGDPKQYDASRLAIIMEPPKYYQPSSLEPKNAFGDAEFSSGSKEMQQINPIVQKMVVVWR